MVLEKTLENRLYCKEIKQVNPKGNQSLILEGLMLKLKLQYFGPLMRRTDSFEKTLMLGKIAGGFFAIEPLRKFGISLSNEYSELVSFRIDLFDLLAVQVILKSLLPHHSSFYD